MKTSTTARPRITSWAAPRPTTPHSQRLAICQQIAPLFAWSAAILAQTENRAARHDREFRRYSANSRRVQTPQVHAALVRDARHSGPSWARILNDHLITRGEIKAALRGLGDIPHRRFAACCRHLARIPDSKFDICGFASRRLAVASRLCDSFTDAAWLTESEAEAMVSILPGAAF